MSREDHPKVYKTESGVELHSAIGIAMHKFLTGASRTKEEVLKDIKYLKEIPLTLGNMDELMLKLKDLKNELLLIELEEEEAERKELFKPI